ncbi:MAG: hypothetical protein KZQ66_03580 [Candidatus Thiodiazotropha sp. (ex Lucinoma aequizonata)]|nr:hypothetical protein [Candidatus Thiodiazotropha sp. (ex Lucinoma aequizonata)]MCU7889906.1 hypothetical protein [Candidatus Thiodiazotropha sp. (ex Lucinoma aequizonata)]MCU7894409.1 hypothetical protein [Candidatus Thiodiazotropha sp. (ex Lucinoma aequizonata)]MCU7899819.1 hypothetical protein [Candidatus Thiodiazotropha sp. (ex Lucinoma aequizonata)]MCU7901197.1 hypothetical protein [Candidatus Thiodiazotropha sp. (ex Lucinoma aequizonata)]
MIEREIMLEFRLDDDYGINQLNMYARVILKYQNAPDYELRVDRFKQQYLKGIYFNHFPSNSISSEDMHTSYNDKSGWQTCPDDWLERHVSDWNKTIKDVESKEELYSILDDPLMSGLSFESEYEHEDESQGEFAFRKRLADIIQSVRIDISEGHINDDGDSIMQVHIRNRVYGLEEGYIPDEMLIRAIRREKEGLVQLDREGFDLYMDDQ